MRRAKFSKNESFSSLEARMHANTDFYSVSLIPAEHFFNPFRHRGFASHHITFESFFFVRRWHSDCIVKITLRKQSMHRRRFIGEAHESSSTPSEATGFCYSSASAVMHDAITGTSC